ncbi:MAG: hypothetical protein GTO26_11090 [Planctomycetales bacterium]|nr:hypothetical protein [Planctomycetales bacterium]
MMAVAGMVLGPGLLRAAELHPAAAQAASGKTIDVVMGRNGLLTGRVMDRRGQAVAGTLVTVLEGNSVVSQVKTDRGGHFHVVGLAAGVHQLITPQGHQVCRLWQPEAAPPAAVRSVQLLLRDKVVAGQYSPLTCWLADPAVMAGMTAVLIAVPVAVHNNRQDRGSGS